MRRDSDIETLHDDVEVLATTAHGVTFAVKTRGFRSLKRRTAAKTSFVPPTPGALPEGFTHLVRETTDGATQWHLVDHEPKRQAVTSTNVPILCRFLYIVPHDAHTGACQSENGLHTMAVDVGAEQTTQRAATTAVAQSHESGV